MGLGPVFWLILSEIYPSAHPGPRHERRDGRQLERQLIVALSFLTLTQVLGKAGTFWLFGVVTIGGMVLCVFLVPETKGKTLEQIETYMRSGKHPRTL